jgi:orotate phosphoribosyltransferase
LTSGKAIREAVGLIAQKGASIAGAVIALDRQERDESGDTAVANLAVEIAAPVISIANLADVIQYLDSQVQGGEYSAKIFAKVQNYRSEFC